MSSPPRRPTKATAPLRPGNAASAGAARIPPASIAKHPASPTIARRTPPEHGGALIGASFACHRAPARAGHPARHAVAQPARRAVLGDPAVGADREAEEPGRVAPP